MCPQRAFNNSYSRQSADDYLLLWVILLYDMTFKLFSCFDVSQMSHDDMTLASLSY